MNAINPPSWRSKTVSVLLYALALLLVLLAPLLGLMAAVVGTWHALVAGSFWYMPLGLILLLAVVALAHNHKPFDLALLGLLVLAVIAWFIAEPLQQLQLLDAFRALVAQTSVMGILLSMMILLLGLLYATRLVGSRTVRSRLVWIGLPAILLLSISAFGGNLLRGLA